ncbi:MOSC domain-containing protein [Sphingomonas sp. HITSZ_GF]|uniref:MOSC domain-containing protein n=1 Tax=Sphingomonas sp. HITSZ_GF TaxID=3037247 RepID=UPI00240D052B|nr:MOSC N-terminal beta barrel domain-containing protein [Sphingomonas sp. HITSZ_GF]MDG2532998.1 MOSC domain-containing protein [Sphingomonas sp. HITSZ_GF]
MTRIVGHVSALNRFPVKSMAGERLHVAELDWQGIEGDRQYAFVRATNGTRFPWLTAREVPAMVLHHARFDDPARPKTSAVTVETPDGTILSLHDALLKGHLEEAAREPAALIQMARGIYDSMPVSIQSSTGHAALEAAHGEPLDIDRFRINVIVDSDMPASDWQGRRLAFGDEADGAMVQCAEPIKRCVIVTIDPVTGAKEPRVLRTVARDFGACYGIYAGPARPGIIRVGDAVRLME